MNAACLSRVTSRRKRTQSVTRVCIQSTSLFGRTHHTSFALCCARHEVYIYLWNISELGFFDIYAHTYAVCVSRCERVFFCVLTIEIRECIRFVRWVLHGISCLNPRSVGAARSPPHLRNSLHINICTHRHRIDVCTFVRQDGLSERFYYWTGGNCTHYNYIVRVRLILIGFMSYLVRKWKQHIMSPRPFTQ